MVHKELTDKLFFQVFFAPIVGLQLKAYQYGGSKHQWNVRIGDLYIALRVSSILELQELCL